MSMTTGGGGGGYSSEINVTPMIDILLVLLIIFMVIVPVTPKGLDALVPQPPKDPTKQPPPTDRTIVVQVGYRAGAAPTYKINETDVNKADLLPRLTEIYAPSASCSSAATTMSTSPQSLKLSTSAKRPTWITSV